MKIVTTLWFSLRKIPKWTETILRIHGDTYFFNYSPSPSQTGNLDGLAGFSPQPSKKLVAKKIKMISNSILNADVLWTYDMDIYDS